MSKNSETIKAIEGLESDQKQVVEELLQIIGQLVQRFDEEAIEYRKSLMENADYGDDSDTYYDELSTLISSLIDDLNASLERFKKIALSYGKYDPEVEGIAIEQQRATEQIWEIVNQLSKGTEEDEDEDDFKFVPDDEFDDEADDLPSLLDKLNSKLMDFEENIVILIKLYNSNSKLPRLSLPTLFFSNSDTLPDNPLIRALTNKGIDLN